MINCILDFDPGVDDAAALFVMKKAKNLNLLALSSVNGNVSLDHTTRNMQCLAKLLDIDVPMAKGQEVPLVREPFFATVHGNDGMAGFRHMIESDDVNELTSENSVIMMHEIIQNSKEKITIIAVGPLTNIALLLKTFPEDKEKIEQISIMGGSITSGNVTSLSEFNFYVDPEAAKIVFESGVDIIMAGLNITEKANITREQIMLLDTIENRKSKFAHRILDYYLSNDSGIHDPCSVIVLDDPEVFEMEDMYIKIDVQNDETRGMSYRDLRKERNGHYNCKVITEIDIEKFRKILMDAFTE